MNKVTIVSQLPPPKNGSTIMTEFLKSKLSQAGFEVTVVSKNLSSASSQIGKFRVSKIIKAVSFLFRLLTEIRRKKPDVAVYFLTNRLASFILDAVAIQLLRTHELRYLTYIHTNGYTDLRQKNPILRKLLDKILVNAETNVVLNRTSLVDISPPGQNIRTRIIANAIEINHFDRSKSDVCKRLLFASNLMPEKGISDFCELVNSLNTDGEDFRVNIAGSETYSGQFDEILNLAKSKGWINKLEHLGTLPRQDLHTLMARSRVLVFPSTYSFELQPLVLIEALSSGLPVISYSIPVMSEMASDFGGIHLVMPHDLDGLKTLVMKFFMDDNFWRIESARAEDSGLRMNDEESFAKNWSEILS